MVIFKEFSLPGHIFMDLPFRKAVDSRGTIQKGINIKITEASILSTIEDIGDLELVKAILEEDLKNIIRDVAKHKITLVSLRSFFNDNNMIKLEEHPGLFLKKKSLKFEEV